MNDPTRFLIRKGTDVWVAKGVSFPCVLTKHTMLKDMSIPYPVAASVEGPKVVGLSQECGDLSASQIMVLEALMVESTMFSKRGRVTSASFYSLLNFGWDIFATGDKEYPFLVAQSKQVDEIDNEWDVEDVDGSLMHRLKWDEFRQALASFDGVHAPTKAKIKPFTETDVIE